jgi:hypothetical protein
MKNKNTSLLNRLTDCFEEYFFNHPIISSFVFTVVGFIVMFILLTVPVISINYYYGVDGFGPIKEHTITVERLYVDGGKQSHYMVGTDKGVFEVQNHLIPIQIFNSDELYSKLEVGKTYNVTVKGNKVLNWFMQQYPYIIEIK